MRERAAENDAPPAGEFCHRHWSWLCQAGQGKCGDGVPTTRLRVNVNDDCAEHLEAMRDDVHDLNPYRAAPAHRGGVVTEHTAENDAPCRLGRIEYDGAQYCHEHGGFLEPGVQSRRCRLAPPVAGLGAPARVIPPGSRDQA